jgi:hypothetical protein
LVYHWNVNEYTANKILEKNRSDFKRGFQLPAALNHQPLAEYEKDGRMMPHFSHSLPGGSLGPTWAGLAPADRASFAWRLLSLDHLVGEFWLASTRN